MPRTIAISVEDEVAERLEAMAREEGQDLREFVKTLLLLHAEMRGEGHVATHIRRPEASDTDHAKEERPFSGLQDALDTGDLGTTSDLSRSRRRTHPHRGDSRITREDQAKLGRLGDEEPQYRRRGEEDPTLSVPNLVTWSDMLQRRVTVPASALYVLACLCYEVDSSVSIDEMTAEVRFWLQRAEALVADVTELPSFDEVDSVFRLHERSRRSMEAEGTHALMAQGQTDAVLALLQTVPDVDSSEVRLGPVRRHPEVCSGALTFVDSRVWVDSLIGYLRGGDTIDDWLEGFPTVPRAHAEETLEMALRLLESSTRTLAAAADARSRMEAERAAAADPTHPDGLEDNSDLD